MTEATHVYFIRPVGMDGPIKIGCSQKPLQRLKALSPWSPFPLELIGSVRGDFGDEVELHKRFSDLHTHREWFMSSPLLRHAIERILGGESISDVCRDIAPKKSIRNQNKPIRTPDRDLFLQYGRKIKRAIEKRSNKEGSYYTPSDIKTIMHRWRCDRVNGHLPITPSPEEFARLDEYIADPMATAVFRKWRDIRPIPGPIIESNKSRVLSIKAEAVG